MDDREFRGEMMLMNDINDGLKKFSPKLSPPMIYDVSSKVLMEIKIIGQGATKKVLENYFQPGFEEASKRLSEHAAKKAIERIRVKTVIEA